MRVSIVGLIAGTGTGIWILTKIEPSNLSLGQVILLATGLIAAITFIAFLSYKYVGEKEKS